MSKIKCECDVKSFVPPEREHNYSDEEKLGMNHEPNECKGTNKIKLYKRNGKKIYLCSCCNSFEDKEINATNQ